MEQYVIKGGQPLEGEVTIAGAKNAALGILAAAVMTDQEVIIENVPNVRDTRVLLQAIEGIGAKVRYIDEHTVSICGASINPNSDLCVDDEFIRKIRASYYLLGALLGKYKRSQVALPGGCDIGARPINLHIKGFEALGAQVDITNGTISTYAEELIGSHIYMDVASVGATINIMMAAVLAEGKTTIENAAKEPHIVDVANFLNSMGANPFIRNSILFQAIGHHIIYILDKDNIGIQVIQILNQRAVPSRTEQQFAFIAERFVLHIGSNRIRTRFLFRK